MKCGSSYVNSFIQMSKNGVTDRLILAGSCFCEDSRERPLQNLTAAATTATNLALDNT